MGCFFSTSSNQDKDKAEPQRQVSLVLEKQIEAVNVLSTGDIKDATDDDVLAVVQALLPGAANEFTPEQANALSIRLLKKVAKVLQPHQADMLIARLDDPAKKKIVGRASRTNVRQISRRKSTPCPKNGDKARELREEVSRVNASQAPKAPTSDTLAPPSSPVMGQQDTDLDDGLGRPSAHKESSAPQSRPAMTQLFSNERDDWTPNESTIHEGSDDERLLQEPTCSTPAGDWQRLLSDENNSPPVPKATPHNVHQSQATAQQQNDNAAVVGYVEGQYGRRFTQYDVRVKNKAHNFDEIASELAQTSGGPPRPSGATRRLAHLDEYQHSSPVPLALFLMMFFIVGVVWLRFTRSSAEPKKRSRKATAMKTEGRNSRSL